MSRIIEPTSGELRYAIIDFACANGWRYHAPPSPVFGWPFLLLVRAPRVLFVLPKADHESITPSESDWLGDLRGSGMDVRVWFDSDWSEIESVLARKLVCA